MQGWISGETCSSYSDIIIKNLTLFYLLFLPWQWRLSDDLSSSRFFSRVNKPAVTVLNSYPFISFPHTELEAGAWQGPKSQAQKEKERFTG